MHDWSFNKIMENDININQLLAADRILLENDEWHCFVD